MARIFCPYVGICPSLSFQRWWSCLIYAYFVCVCMFMLVYSHMHAWVWENKPHEGMGFCLISLLLCPSAYNSSWYIKIFPWVIILFVCVGSINVIIIHSISFSIFYRNHLDNDLEVWLFKYKYSMSGLGEPFVTSAILSSVVLSLAEVLVSARNNHLTGPTKIIQCVLLNKKCRPWASQVLSISLFCSPR